MEKIAGQDSSKEQHESKSSHHSLQRSDPIPAHPHKTFLGSLCIDRTISASVFIGLTLSKTSDEYDRSPCRPVADFDPCRRRISALPAVHLVPSAPEARTRF